MTSITMQLMGYPIILLALALICGSARAQTDRVPKEPPKLPDARDVGRKAYNATATSGFAQTDGEAAYAAFMAWRNTPENRSLKWEEATEKYSAKLIASGMKPAEAART